jgi:hypothetical protein
MTYGSERSEYFQAQVSLKAVRTIGDIRAFVTGSQAADFAVTDRDPAYRFVAATLTRFGYQRCCRRPTRAGCAAI